MGKRPLALPERLALAIGLVLVLGAAVGGFLAWQRGGLGTPRLAGAMERAQEPQELERSLALDAEAQGAEPLAQPRSPTENPSVSKTHSEAHVVEGRIIDAEGSGAEGWIVRLQSAEREHGRATSGPDGGFRIDDLLSGKYELLLGESREGEESFLEPHPLDLSSPLLELGDIALPPLGSAEVLVLDDTGLVVPEARVRVQRHPRGVMLAETDAEGRALLQRLPAGELRVFASHPTYGRSTLPFMLEPGATAKIQLTLVRRSS